MSLPCCVSLIYYLILIFRPLLLCRNPALIYSFAKKICWSYFGWRLFSAIILHICLLYRTYCTRLIKDITSNITIRLFLIIFHKFSQCVIMRLIIYISHVDWTHAGGAIYICYSISGLLLHNLWNRFMSFIEKLSFMW